MKTNKVQAALEDQAEELKNGVGKMIGNAREKAGEYYDLAKDRVRDWSDDGLDYVRDNPVKTVATTLALGFAIGWLFRR